MPLTVCLYTELRTPQSFGTPRQKCKHLSTWMSTPLLNKIPIIIPIIITPPEKHLLMVLSPNLLSFPFSLAPEVASPSFSLCFVSFDQLSFSSYRPIKMFPHPTSLERKLDVEEKRVIYAYNW